MVVGRVKNSLNAAAFPKNYEVNTMPSETVPDQTLSIREILERYARGLPLDGQRVPIYDEDDEMPDPKHLDLAERQELKEQYAEEIQEIKRRNKKKTAPKGKDEALAVYTGEAKAAKPAQSMEHSKPQEQPDTPANL